MMILLHYQEMMKLHGIGQMMQKLWITEIVNAFEGEGQPSHSRNRIEVPGEEVDRESPAVIKIHESIRFCVS